VILTSATVSHLTLIRRGIMLKGNFNGTVTMRSHWPFLLLPFVAFGCTHAPAPVAPTTGDSLRFDQGHPVIVRMVGRRNALTVSSTPRGPAYSVADRGGLTILSAGTLDDLRRIDPLLYRQLKEGLVTAADPVQKTDAQRWDEDPWAGQMLAR